MIATAVLPRPRSVKHTSRPTNRGLSMDEYIRDIARIPLLTAAEERELAVRVRAGDDVARDQMVRCNLRLVVNLARGFTGRGLDLPDLIAEGNLGLLRAVEGFDPAMRTRFSTYAAYWIRQSIQRALIYTGKPIRIPAYLVQLLRRWRQATAALQDKLRRTPTEEEIARSLRLTKRQQALIKSGIRSYTSVPQAEYGEHALSLEELVEDGDTLPAAERMAGNEESQRVLSLVDRLEPRWARVLQMRFGLDGEEPRTLREIGEQLGLTRERVRQIEIKALQQLSEELKAG